MLVSGTGLVGLVVWNLWRSLRDADARAILDARRDADAAAQALGSLLREERFLDALPETVRIQVAGGAVVVPPEVGWIDDPPDLDPEAELDPVLRQKLDRAAALAFAGDPAGAESHLTDMLADPVLLGDARPWLEARLAWVAHRHGDVALRDRLLAELDSKAPTTRAAAASTALLWATVHGTLPDWADDALRTLPPDLARAVFARLRVHGVATDGLESALDATVARREVLRLVTPLAPALLAAAAPGAPAVRELDGRLCVFHGTDTGSGRGALVEPGALLDAIDRLNSAGGEASPTLPLAPRSGELVTGMAANPNAADLRDVRIVVPGVLGVRPRQVAGSGFWSEPSSLAAVIAVLAAICALGMLSAFRMLRREAEATRLRAEFLTTVTHELKTPLAGIRLLAEMLDANHVKTEAQRREYFARLSSESGRLSSLIENVLDLGRMERGERAYDLRTTDVRDVVREAAELFAPVAERDGMRVVLDVGGSDVGGIDGDGSDGSGAPVRALVDRGALTQALLNVMDNARKYARDGGPLEVSAGARNGVFEISVRDRGQGIPPGERARVFERFQRGTRHLDGSIPGVGLGLYLARTILRRHGGELACTAPPDGGPGAYFSFTLPIEQPAGVAAENPAATDGARRNGEPEDTP